MKHWCYKPLEWLLSGVSRLPLWMLYGLADALFFIIYYVWRYRRKVVRKHLSDSFPDMSPKQLKRVERQFYRNFADLVVETIKVESISEKELRKRMIFNGMDVVDRLFDEGRPIVAYFSHTGNWEWVPSITLWTRHQCRVDCEFAQVYRPLRNKWMDSYMLKLRGRFGPRSFAKSTVLRDLIMLRRANMPWITGFMSDQKPSHGDPTYVTTFLNHPTALITGTETLARKLRAACVYMDMHKDRRGHYHVDITLMAEDASTTEPMALTAQYGQLLERTIRRNPPIWLWTHKRWKRPVTLPQASAEPRGAGLGRPTPTAPGPPQQDGGRVAPGSLQQDGRRVAPGSLQQDGRRVAPGPLPQGENSSNLYSLL